MKVDSRTLVSDIVLYDVATLPLLMRFGVRPGYGSLTVGSFCSKAGIELSFFLPLMNAALNPEETSEEPEESLICHRGEVVRFLMATDEWYKRTQLPNIARHFALLRERSANAGAKNLEALGHFYTQLEREFEARHSFDFEHLFPALESGGEIDRKLVKSSSVYDHCLLDETEDLLTFFVVHLKGEYDPNLLMAVVSAVDAMRRDLILNNRIRSRLLK